MDHYYANKNPQFNGDHEVHKSNCFKLPNEENRRYLGSFYNCYDAVKEAKKYDPTADGCYHCSKECHTR